MQMIFFIYKPFKVKHYLDDETYRVVRNDKHIYFIESTKCVKNMSEGLKIKPHIFGVFVLEKIENIANYNRLLISNVILA